MARDAAVTQDDVTAYDDRTCTGTLASCAPDSRIVYALSPGRYTLLAIYSVASLMCALVWNIMVRVRPSCL